MNLISFINSVNESILQSNRGTQILHYTFVDASSEIKSPKKASLIQHLHPSYVSTKPTRTPSLNFSKSILCAASNEPRTSHTALQYNERKQTFTFEIVFEYGEGKYFENEAIKSEITD